MRDPVTSLHWEAALAWWFAFWFIVVFWISDLQGMSLIDHGVAAFCTLGSAGMVIRAMILAKVKRDTLEAARAIAFAVDIDDHFDRLEFLRGWVYGDLSEWPEFKSAMPHAHATRDDVGRPTRAGDPQ